MMMNDDDDHDDDHDHDHGIDDDDDDHDHGIDDGYTIYILSLSVGGGLWRRQPVRSAWFARNATTCHLCLQATYSMTMDTCI